MIRNQYRLTYDHLYQENPAIYKTASYFFRLCSIYTLSCERLVSLTSLLQSLKGLFFQIASFWKPKSFTVFHTKSSTNRKWDPAMGSLNHFRSISYSIALPCSSSKPIIIAPGALILFKDIAKSSTPTILGTRIIPLSIPVDLNSPW